MFNPNLFIGPQAYPTGFPLILAPFVKHYGFNFEVLNYVMTFFLMALSILGFLFLRNYFSNTTSFFTTLLIAYNPIILNFKTEIVSDFSFTTLLLFCVLLIPKNKNAFTALILGFTMAFLAHIRAIGLLVPIVYVVHQLFFENKIQQFNFKIHKELVYTTLSFLIIYFSVKFAFPCNTNYPAFFEFAGLISRVTEHVSYNLLALSTFFNIYEPKNQYFIGVISSSAIIIFSLLGFIYQWKAQRYSFLNLFFLSYIGSIAFFKFSDTGIRFLIPILFLIFYYAIIGLKMALKDIVINWKLTSLAFGLIILLSYKPAIEKIIETKHQIIEGPCNNPSFDMFIKIKSLNLTNDIIVFEKPRALALFTNTKAIAFENDLNSQELLKQLLQFKAKYILLNKNLPNKSLINYTNAVDIKPLLVYSNSDYVLYKLN